MLAAAYLIAAGRGIVRLGVRADAMKSILRAHLDTAAPLPARQEDFSIT